jgi:multiple sugar transport system permease protein
LTIRFGHIRRQTLYRLLCLAVLVPLAAVTLFPLAWIVSGSLKPAEQVFLRPIKWIPDPIRWNYPRAWFSADFTQYLVNSVLVTVTQIVLHLFFASLAGFGFAKYHFWGKEVLFVIVLSMMILPIHVIMVPLFLIVRNFGWINTYQGLIIPTAISAFGVFFMRQFIAGIPDEYIDAARIDGASGLTIFFKVIVPMSTAPLITLGILIGLASWDEFLWPLIVVGDQKLATLPLGISYMKTNYAFPAHHMLAIAVVMMLVPLLSFIFAQRRIIENVGLSGIK